MEKLTCIKIKAIDQRLSVVQQPLLASGDVGTVRVEYELDRHWDGFLPSGTFYTGKKPEDVYEQILLDGACVIPWEVLQEDGVLYIGLRGIDAEGLIKTAAPVRYRVEKGSPCGSDTTADPTPNPYQQTLAKVAEHTENKENPHGVTAEQVGARPNTWTPTAADVGARPNTWTPTAADVGAASSGYGYGEPCVSFYFTGSESVTNFENALNETLAGMLDKEAKQICVTCTGIADTTLYGTLYRHTADYAIIKLTTYYQDSSITKCKWAGKWEPHSWENPPMQVGVEYRTTERWSGMPVYTKLIEFGHLPNATTKIVEYILPYNITAISITGFGKSATGSQELPSADVLLEVNNEWGYVIANTKTNMSSYYAYITVKYTKN